MNVQLNIARVVMLLLYVWACGLLSGCSPQDSAGIEGALLFQDQPLAEAQVEIYLKADKDRSIQPFAVATTDSEGKYRLSLPGGHYFIIGKKRESQDGGRVRILMAESPGNPHQVANQMTSIPSFNLREMGREGFLATDSGTRIFGRVTFKGDAVPRAFVYVYADTGAGLIGPSYGEAVQTSKDGRFSINLPPGQYSLVARKRSDGSRSGALSLGDWNSRYPDNPIVLQEGAQLDLGDFPLEPVDADIHARRIEEGVFAKTATMLRGLVSDADGLPVSNVYVFAYLDSRMVGKPAHVSVPTGGSGRFELYVGSGGTYYVGARSAFGGPLEPGEWVGTYEGNPDHSVTIAQGAEHDIGIITVREFW